jgi:hypothetical protein
LAKGEEYMETIEAEVVVLDDKHYIQINATPSISIPISDDNANTVKSAFNLLIQRLAKGSFEITLKDAEKDLFYHVASEYIQQLNNELRDVYEEMTQYGFVDESDSES